VKKDRAC